MGDTTRIEWTDRTWNPIVGCTRVSPGCEHCYAERFVHRGLSEQHRGLTVMRNHGPGWTGEVRLVESALAKPLSWRKPQRVFVNSLSDLFHEALSMQTIARVFAVMALAPHLTFQVLTKRPERMRAVLKSALFWEDLDSAIAATPIGSSEPGSQKERVGRALDLIMAIEDTRALPNIWLGVTTEDQQRADERIPLLLDTPAAVRFVSYEPALGPVDFRTAAFNGADSIESLEGLHWLIVGGESGPGARPFDLAWARSAVEQCKAAGVPVFVKQTGARPIDSSDGDVIEGGYVHYTRPMAEAQAMVVGRPGYSVEPHRVKFKHRKGSDMSEWYADLRVREFPAPRTA